MRHAAQLPLVAWTTVCFLVIGHAGAAQVTQPGVVVEEVTKGSAREKAGLRVGDMLLTWERPANPPANPETAEGTIASVFDWMWVETEQGPRGRVKVIGERAGQETTFDLPMGNWGLKVRPRFVGEALEAYAEGLAAIAAKELAKGIARWTDIAKSGKLADDWRIACWINLRAGDTWVDARAWQEAQTAHESARVMAEAARNVVAHAVIWDSIGSALEKQSKFDEAEKAYGSAMALRERDGDSLSLARSLNSLGLVARIRGELATAEMYYKRALAIREKSAPGSLDVATSLNNLGNVARVRGELSTAETYYTRTLAIQEKLSPDGLEVAGSLNNLGIVAWLRGELPSADAYHKRSLAIKEQLAPDTLTVATSLNNLGLVASDRGELATTEDYYRRALAIQEKLAPDSLPLSAYLNNLGAVAHNRGDLAMAELYYKRALAIREKLAPERFDLAVSLNNLGIVARDRGDLPAAQSYLQRALPIFEKLSPVSLDVAAALGNLGIVASLRGELSIAEAYYKRALAIHDKLAPDSLNLARSLKHLGMVARDSGSLTAAEAYFTRALSIRRKLSPGSSDEAASEHDLGLLYRKANRNQLASDHLRHAIDALEAQVGKLGGSQETQSGFGAQFADYYSDSIDLLIEQNQPADAFRILERSRAQTLRAMLAERDLVFTADVPADLERDRKRTAWEFDQAQAKLARLNPAKEQAQIDASLTQLRELRDRQSDIVARIRQQAPRLASLQYPQALDVNGVRAALDPGTLLLSYSVGKDKSYRFALTPETGVQVYALAVGETQLRAAVERFRSLIGRAQLGTTDQSGLAERGRELYETLMQPAAKTLEKAARVLVVPDGPLHALPFAALVRPTDAKAGGAHRDWQYFVEWKPVHVVVSATVYAELRKARHPQRVAATEKTLIAFGDPMYPADAAIGSNTTPVRQDAVVRSLLTRGYRLTPLPATKNEVATIASLYRGSADTYLGAAATEERAKGVAKDASYLHFASHGLLDERFPLNSGLALTIPAEMKEGQDNGILQAWEIFERLRIDADLVVLSACDTGLGKEMGGEGLVGLTRAFHYAGARSVLASLWSVADDTTAELMKRFYGYLKAGQSKDAALRQAQLDLIRGPVASRDRQAATRKVEASHPFYWAAFQLNGDWR